MPKPVEVWFEFASTYTHIVLWHLTGPDAPTDVEIRWRPFLLGPIFQAQGWNTSPFNIYESKGRYMWRDMERLCADQGIPFRRPTIFPAHSLKAARVAILGQDEAWLPGFVRGVTLAQFRDDRDISDPAVLAVVLTDQGLDAKAILTAAEAPENKPRLRAQTEEAQRLGIFGAPTLKVGDELFWGADRLEQALRWARG